MEFLQPSCTKTLQEGLDELYREAPEVAEVSRRKGKGFRDHDLTHVIFGCDTSIRGELLLNPWILLGTTISRQELRDYGADPEVKRLNREGYDLLGGRLKAVLIMIFYYLPLYAWLWVTHIRPMSRKWPHSQVTDVMLDTPLDVHRQEYGIRIYSPPRL